MKTLRKAHWMSFKEALIERQNRPAQKRMSQAIHRDNTAHKFALEDGLAPQIMHFTDVGSYGCLP